MARAEGLMLVLTLGCLLFGTLSLPEKDQHHHQARKGYQKEDTQEQQRLQGADDKHPGLSGLLANLQQQGHLSKHGHSVIASSLGQAQAAGASRRRRRSGRRRRRRRNQAKPNGWLVTPLWMQHPAFKGALPGMAEGIAVVLLRTARYGCQSRIVKNFADSCWTKGDSSAPGNHGCTCKDDGMSSFWESFRTGVNHKVYKANLPFPKEQGDLGEDDQFIMDTFKSVASTLILKAKKVVTAAAGGLKKKVGSLVLSGVDRMMQSFLPKILQWAIRTFTGKSISDDAYTCICEAYILPWANPRFKVWMSKAILPDVKPGDGDSFQKHFLDPVVWDIERRDQKGEAICRYRAKATYGMCMNKDCNTHSEECFKHVKYAGKGYQKSIERTTSDLQQCYPNKSSCRGGYITKDVELKITKGQKLHHCQEFFVMVDTFTRIVVGFHSALQAMVLYPTQTCR
jgi:hypothetical protein